MTTRFLFSSISAALFAGELTLDEIHEEWAADACQAFQEGLDEARLQVLVATCIFRILDPMFFTILGPYMESFGLCPTSNHTFRQGMVRSCIWSALAARATGSTSAKIPGS